MRREHNPISPNLTPEEEELIEDVKAKINAQESLTSYRQAEYQLNRMFLANYQWVRYLTQSRKFAGIQSKVKRIRMTVNKIVQLATRNVSELMVASPDFFIEPASNDSEDVRKAKISENVLRSAWKFHRLKAKERRWLWNMQPTGITLLHVWWDHSAPAIMQTKKGPLLVQGQGEAQVDIQPPGGMILDPFAADLEDATWMMVRNDRDIDWFYRHWPDKAIYVVPTSRQDRVYGRVDEFWGGLDGRDQQTMRAEEIRYWERPSSTHPQGRYVIATRDVILEEHTLAEMYEDADFPFVCVREKIQPESFWPMSKMSLVRDLQVRYNTKWSQWAELGNLQAVPKIMAPAGSIKNYKQFSPLYTGAIEVEPFAQWEPKVIDFGGNNREIVAEIRAISEAMDDIYDTSRPYEGKTSGSVRSGRQLRMIQQTQALGHTGTNEGYSDGMELLAKKLLACYHKNARHTRVARWMDERGDLQLRNWTNTDIVTSGDIQLLTKPGARLAKEQRKAEVAEATQYGALQPATNKEDRELYFRAMEWQNPRRLYDQAGKDIVRAQSENDRIMAAGVLAMQPDNIIAPNDFDDHEIHIREHDSARKAMDFDEQPQQVHEGMMWHKLYHVEVLTGQPVATGNPNSPFFDPASLEQAQVQGQAQPQAAEQPGPENQSPGNGGPLPGPTFRPDLQAGELTNTPEPMDTLEAQPINRMT